LVVKKKERKKKDSKEAGLYWLIELVSEALLHSRGDCAKIAVDFCRRAAQDERYDAVLLDG
jgi:hypothetical protein